MRGSNSSFPPVRFENPLSCTVKTSKVFAASKWLSVSLCRKEWFLSQREDEACLDLTQNCLATHRQEERIHARRISLDRKRASRENRGALHAERHFFPAELAELSALSCKNDPPALSRRAWRGYHRRSQLPAQEAVRFSAHSGIGRDPRSSSAIGEMTFDEERIEATSFESPSGSVSQNYRPPMTQTYILSGSRSLRAARLKSFGSLRFGKPSESVSFSELASPRLLVAGRVCELLQPARLHSSVTPQIPSERTTARRCEWHRFV
jgi:hypothetical protein